MNYFQKRKTARSLYKDHIKIWDQGKIKDLTNIIIHAEGRLAMIPDIWHFDLPNMISSMHFQCLKVLSVLDYGWQWHYDRVDGNPVEYVLLLADRIYELLEIISKYFPRSSYIKKDGIYYDMHCISYTSIHVSIEELHNKYMKLKEIEMSNIKGNVLPSVMLFHKLCNHCIVDSAECLYKLWCIEMVSLKFDVILISSSLLERWESTGDYIGHIHSLKRNMSIYAKDISDFLKNMQKNEEFINDNTTITRYYEFSSDILNTEFKNASYAYTKPYVSGRTYVLC